MEHKKRNYFILMVFVATIGYGMDGFEGALVWMFIFTLVGLAFFSRD